MMSAARFAQIMGGMNTPAKKVYEVVPIEAAWTAAAICSEANKTRNVSYDVVRGCLDVLEKAGLIRQTDGTFQREPVRQKKEKVGLPDLKEALQEAQAAPAQAAPVQATAQVVVRAPQPKPQEKAHMQKPETNIVDQIGNLAQRLAAMAQRHHQEMKDLAGTISDAAIEVQAKLEKTEEDLVKYRQLQALLKGIGE